MKSLGKEWLSTYDKFYLSPLVCFNPKPPLFIISNTDLDFLSSNLPTSPPIAPVLNVGLVSVGTEMTVACKIPLNLFPIKLLLTFIHSNISIDQIKGSGQGAVDFLQHTSPILTGHACSKSLCSISENSPGSDFPIPSVLNAEVMPTSQYSHKYSSGLLKSDRSCRVLNKPSC